ncbi:DUF167 domain-containing protein [Homoserinibacter sp. GY 40078]|uniref:DUF167 domain-containing protein n=1 Tax=Homoserinibacter sp. GY 40078 TaxID=2603275 RepID=UPI0011CBAEDA|nr:DUF167 domain-containing protein [Homoserinibacter sp. GY 40078]TXK16357.1 DUF167 domain-containing protein [Homoserinibacter sp. GY 40078]
MAELVQVRVKPGSSKGPLVEEGPDGVLVVHVRERAVEGAANEAVVKVVAAHFGMRRRDVTIRRGHTSRQKTLELDR